MATRPAESAPRSAHLAVALARVQRRIDDLENFYVANVDDERSVLFEKQRLKLRKLLHEVRRGRAQRCAATPNAWLTPASPSTQFDTASYGPTSVTAAAAPASGGDAPAGRGVPPPPLPPVPASLSAGSAAASAAAPPPATTTRIVREDTRLTSAELCAWFEQAGRSEMP